MKAASYQQALECRTMDGRSEWSLMKEFLDHIRMGEKFTRSEQLNYIYIGNASLTFKSYITNSDLYRRYLMNIGFIESMGIYYKKLYNIPKNASLQMIMKYAFRKGSWEDWFIPKEERINKIVEECRLNHVL